MAKEGPNWEGLLKWSLANSDGTRPPRNFRCPSISIYQFVYICMKMDKLLSLL